MGYEWSELSYIEKEAGKSELRIPGVFTFRGDTTVVVFGLSCAFVFLILAAQSERWSLPLAVLLAIPFALVCALVAIWLLGLNNDDYFQIGLVTLIGLASKNAILIVEFAVLNRQQGLSA